MSNAPGKSCGKGITLVDATRKFSDESKTEEWVCDHFGSEECVELIRGE